MKKWQIGIATPSGLSVSWKEDYVQAATKREAEELALKKGYYRNLRVRAV